MTTQRDRELREWLRSIDPAADLAPMSRVEVTALLLRAGDSAEPEAAAPRAVRARLRRPARSQAKGPQDKALTVEGAKDAATTDAAADGTVAKDPAAKDTAPKDPGLKDPVAQDPVAKETPAQAAAGATTTRAKLDPAASTTTTEMLISEPADGAMGSRRPFPWLVAAVAVLVVAVGGFALTRDHEAAEAPPVVEPAVSSTTVSAPDAASTRCAMPTPELLSGVDVAVDATVRAVEDGRVRLAVQKWYAGTPTEELVVTAPPDALQELIGAPDLRIGQRYLLAAKDGELMVCGFSGPIDPDRSTLYTTAFGG